MTDGEVEDEAELLRAARHDDAAFTRLVSLHIPAVFAEALRQVRDEDDAQDVMQRTLEIAYDKRTRIRLASGSIRGWLLLTCRNVALNKLTSADHRHTTATANPLPSTMQTQDESEFERVEYQQLVESLRKEVAAVNTLDGRVFEGIASERAHAEIAAELGISTANVKKRAYRIRALIRRRWEGMQ